MFPSLLTSLTTVYQLLLLGSIVFRLLSWSWFRALLKRIPAVNKHLRKRPKIPTVVGLRSLSWLCGWYGVAGIVSIVVQFPLELLLGLELGKPEITGNALSLTLGLTGLLALGIAMLTLGIASLGYLAARQLASPVHLALVPGDCSPQRQSQTAIPFIAACLRWWGFVLALYGSLTLLILLILQAGLWWRAWRQAAALGIIVCCLTWPLVSFLKLRQRMQSPRVRRHIYGLVQDLSAISVLVIAAFHIALLETSQRGLTWMYRPDLWSVAIAAYSLLLGLYCLLPAPKKPRRRRRRTGASRRVNPTA